MSEQTQNLKISVPEEVTSFFRGKKILIIDPKSTARVSIKRLLIKHFLGPDCPEPFLAPTLSEGLEFMKKESPQIVFSELCFEHERDASILLDCAREMSQNGIHHQLFFVTSRMDSPLKVERYYRSSFDALIQKPYSMEIVAEQIITTAMQRSIMIETYERLFQVELSIEGPQAKQTWRKLIEEETMLPEAAARYYFKYKLTGEEAKELIPALERSIELALDPVQSLHALLMIEAEQKNWQAAARLAETIIHRDVVAPDLFELILKALLAVGKEHYLNQFYVFLTSISDDRSNMPTSLAKAFYAKATMLIQQKKVHKIESPADEIIDILHKSCLLGRGDASFLERLADFVMANQIRPLFAKLLEVLQENTDIKPITVQLLKIEMANTEGEGAQVLSEAMRLVHEGHHTPRLYTMILECSKTIGRGPEKLKETLEDAIFHFPELKEQFQSLSKVG